MNRKLLFLILTTALLACTIFGVEMGSTNDTFEGYYASGFEVSSFVPCEAAGEAGYGAGYWLTGTPDFYDTYSRLVTESGHDPVTGYFPVYTVFEGTLSPEGHYGHLGAYTREVTVTKLIEMSLDGTCP
jgi:hypothetical protein